MPLSRPRVTVRDDIRRSRRERPSPLPAPMPGPPPSAPPDRPRSGCPGPSFLLSSVSPPRRPTRGVRPRRHAIPQPVEVILQPLLELPDRHAIDPGRSSVLFDLQPRTPHQLFRDVVRLSQQLRLTHAIPSSRLITLISQDDPHPLAPPPLRYAGTSQLLRVSPPARPQTVLGSLRIPPLGVSPLATNCSVTVSRRTFTCSVREPGPDSCCLYAGHHLGSRRVTPRLLPKQRPNPGFRCHLISFRRFSRQRAFRPIAHLSGPHLTRSLPRLFLHRSRPRSSAKAPVGGLKPPPRKATPEVQKTPPSTHTAPEARHTKPHPRSCSQGLQPTQHVAVCRHPPQERRRRATPSSPAQHHVRKSLPTNRTPFHVRGTRSFSNPMSTRRSATWGWWVRLRRCPSDFVSPSCPIFLVRPAVSRRDVWWDEGCPQLLRCAANNCIPAQSDFNAIEFRLPGSSGGSVTPGAAERGRRETAGQAAPLEVEAKAWPRRQPRIR